MSERPRPHGILHWVVPASQCPAEHTHIKLIKILTAAHSSPRPCIGLLLALGCSPRRATLGNVPTTVGGGIGAVPPQTPKKDRCMTAPTNGSAMSASPKSSPSHSRSQSSSQHSMRSNLLSVEFGDASPAGGRPRRHPMVAHGGNVETFDENIHTLYETFNNAVTKFGKPPLVPTDKLTLQLASPSWAGGQGRRTASLGLIVS